MADNWCVRLISISVDMIEKGEGEVIALWQS